MALKLEWVKPPLSCFITDHDNDAGGGFGGDGGGGGGDGNMNEIMQHLK